MAGKFSTPHWEAIALEQPEIPLTLMKRGGQVVICRSPYGRKRWKDPETGGLLLTSGDLAAFGPFKVRRLYWSQAWHVIPSHDDLMRWTFDGIAETPDGSTVEPDDQDSWLTLLGLI